jgi:exopolysaccharide biosynthesis predicted pyruvyltransferase EpsI
MNIELEILIKQIRNRNLTYLSEERLQNIVSTCIEIEKSEIPGIFVEAGCALGGSSIIIASTKNTKRKLYIYDVFGTIPPPSNKDPEEVHNRFRIISEGKSEGIGGDTYYGYIDNLLDVVYSNFKTFDIDPENQTISFIKGSIQQTMIINEPVAFAHIDVDWYETVMCCLETLFPKLSIGGSVIVDDYYDWGGCKKATDDFLLKVEGEYYTTAEAGTLKITRLDSKQKDANFNPKDSSSFNEINIEDFLKKYSNQNVVYCANPGNAGDALIAHATFQIFEKLNIYPEIIKHEELVYDKIIFYAGGGNLVEDRYKHAYHFINNNIRQNREIILLPHTIYGYSELLLSATNLTIICREKISYQHLLEIGFPSNKLFLAHDLAFHLSKTEFEEYLMNGAGIANCFRTDQESTAAFTIQNDNIDISLSWNGELWHRPDFAKNVTHSLASYLSAFETVKTDRLHIAILAGILGKKVVLFPNNYYKINAVFEYSIKNSFENIILMEIPPSQEMASIETEIIDFQEEKNEVEDTLPKKEQKIIESNIYSEQLKSVFQSNSWKITKPLRYLRSFFKAVTPK